MIDRSIRIKRKLILLIVVAMVFCEAVQIMRVPVYAASVKIGQATSDERGKTSGGKAGDQKNGKEVSVSSWEYSKKNGAYNNWKYVFRAKDPATAKKLAAAMTDACNNKHIGYDQNWPDRASLHDEAKKAGWKIKNVTKDCETTCAQVVAVCVNSVGISMPRYWDSSNVYSDLKKTNKFYIYSDAAHTSKSNLLEPGDILLSPGRHTAMVVTSPNACGAEVKAKNKTSSSSSSSKKTTKFKAGREYTVAVALNVRKGPGTKYAKVLRKNLTKDGKKHSYNTKYGVLKKGTKITCVKMKGNWMKIPSGWVYCGNGYVK